MYLAAVNIASQVASHTCTFVHLAADAIFMAAGITN